MRVLILVNGIVLLFCIGATVWVLVDSYNAANFFQRSTVFILVALGSLAALFGLLAQRRLASRRDDTAGKAH